MSFRFIVTADWHVDTYAQYNRLVSDGVGSRLQNILIAINMIFDYARKNKVDYIFVTGDTLNVSQYLDVLSFIHLWRLFGLLSKERGYPKVVTLVGNHELFYADRPYINGVTLLEPYMDVKSEPDQLVIDMEDYSVRFTFIPYHDSMKHVTDNISKYVAIAENNCRENDYHFLLGHLMVGTGDNMTPIELLQTDKFNACFFGHNHNQHQISPSVWSCGSPLQHNFKDENNTVGFLDVIVNNNNVSINPIHNEISPRFTSLEVFDEENLKQLLQNNPFMTNNYFRVNTGNLKVFEHLKQYWNVKANYIPSGGKVVRTGNISTDDLNGIIERQRMSTSLIPGYVERNTVVNNQTRFTSVGIELFREATEKRFSI